MKRNVGLLIATVLGAGAFATAASTQAPAPAPAETPAPVVAAPPVDPVVEKGAYIAVLGDCAACHTKEGGQPFAGGVVLNTPFGAIYSANITSDKEHGIGGWTLEQFRRAMKKGVDEKGRNLYPAFSYPYYSHVRAADVDALYAYMKTIAPVASDPPKNKMGFPFNVRFLVTFWNWLYLRPAEFVDDKTKSAEWNRGAYLVQGLGHCGACHTPKSPIGGDMYSKALHGGKLDNWLASDLTGAKQGGLGSWEKQDIVDFLKTGINSKTSAYGSMTEVVRFSTSKMTDEDLGAIAEYLKSVPASQPVKVYAKPDPKIMAAGKAVYEKQCATCHQADGSGLSGIYPAFAGNANLTSADATSSLHVVLTGSKTGTLLPLTDDPMPGFAAKLSDQAVADTLTYARNSWGNSAPAVTAKQVAKMRKLVLGKEPKAPEAPATRPPG